MLISVHPSKKTRQGLPPPSQNDAIIEAGDTPPEN